MNLTKKEALILDQLVRAGSSEMYGLEMVKASNNELKMGTIYVTLARLQEKGFVESRKETDPQQAVPRRLYRITGVGHRTYMAWRSAMQTYHAQLHGVPA